MKSLSLILFFYLSANLSAGVVSHDLRIRINPGQNSLEAEDDITLPEYTDGIECFSVTNGPRQVEPLRAIGHRHVMVEVDLHPKTLGVTKIVESEFGAVLRSLV